MQFSDIPGHENLKEQLTAAYAKGKVAHAQLFAGRPQGSALPLALAYASYLMCSDRTSNDSCGKCPNCLRIRKLVHPDVHLVFPKVSASDTGKYDKVLAEALPKFRAFVHEHPFGDLESWAHAYGNDNKNLLISREDSRYILKNVSMRSVEGGYKVLILWLPEMMNPSAANAILKTLEEPPEKTIYLLVSYQYDLLLATITSRTQLVVVPPHTEKEIVEHLVAKGSSNEQAMHAAKLAEGSMGAALSILTEDESQAYEDFQQWMLACWNKDLGSLVRRSEDFSKTGKTNQRSNLSYTLSVIRNAVLAAGGNEPTAQSDGEKSFVLKFAERLGFQKLEKIYPLINEAVLNLDRNSNPRITHLNLSLDIIRVLNG